MVEVLREIQKALHLMLVVVSQIQIKKGGLSRLFNSV
jgi:hypothetical protein